MIRRAEPPGHRYTMLSMDLEDWGLPKLKSIRDAAVARILHSRKVDNEDHLWDAFNSPESVDGGFPRYSPWRAAWYAEKLKKVGELLQDPELPKQP